MKKKNSYYVNRHSCFLLQYHLVLVTKYRHPVMVNIRERILFLISEYFNNWDFPIIEYEICADHLHILFETMPNVNLSNFINGLKTYISRKIRKEFSVELSKYYWKPYFWSESYFIATVSERSTDLVKQYISTQLKH